MAENIKRVPTPDDTRRCQTVNSQGQCMNMAIQLPDGNYGHNCLMHHGNREVDAYNNKAVRNYQLAKWRNRVGDKADSNVIKSLREEVGILRVILEELINSCETNVDLIINSQQISELVLKIEKLVHSCHKLETSMKYLLDKQVIINFATEIIDILTSELSKIDNGDQVLGILSLKIMSVVNRENEE